MNKSKFLKRSLATLLAILMVVAMVPMSAFAAVVIAEDVPTARSIDNPGYEIALNGIPFAWNPESGQYETDFGFVNDGFGSVPSIQLSMIENAATENTSFILQDTNETLTFTNKLVSLESANTVENKGNYGEGDYVFTLETRTETPEGQERNYYRLVIKARLRAADDNTTLLGVYSSQMPEMKTYTIEYSENGGGTITIYMTLDTDLTDVESTNHIDLEATANNGNDDFEALKKIFITPDTVSNMSLNGGYLTITAENGHTDTYKVVLKHENVFSEFALEDGDGTKYVGEPVDGDPQKILITLPYDKFYTDTNYGLSIAPSEATIKTDIEALNPIWTTERLETVVKYAASETAAEAAAERKSGNLKDLTFDKTTSHDTNDKINPDNTANSDKNYIVFTSAVSATNNTNGIFVDTKSRKVDTITSNSSTEYNHTGEVEIIVRVPKYNPSTKLNGIQVMGNKDNDPDAVKAPNTEGTHTSHTWSQYIDVTSNTIDITVPKDVLQEVSGTGKKDEDGNSRAFIKLFGAYGAVVEIPWDFVSIAGQATNDDMNANGFDTDGNKDNVLIKADVAGGDYNNYNTTSDSTILLTEMNNSNKPQVKTVRIEVKSQDGDHTDNYTLRVRELSAEQHVDQLDSITLYDSDGKTEIAKATQVSGKNEYVIQLPYWMGSEDGGTDIESCVIGAVAKNGGRISYYNGNSDGNANDYRAFVRNAKVSDLTRLTPNSFVAEEPNKNTWIRTPDDNTFTLRVWDDTGIEGEDIGKDYLVTFKMAAPDKEQRISDITLMADDIDQNGLDGHDFTTTVDNVNKVITVNLPYEYRDIPRLYLSDIKLDGIGGRVYWGGDTGNALEMLAYKTDEMNFTQVDITPDANNDNGDKTWEANGYTKLYVFSEEAYTRLKHDFNTTASGTYNPVGKDIAVIKGYNTSDNFNYYTEYKVVAKIGEPERLNRLNKEVTASDPFVNVNVDDANQIITLTVPNSYVNDNTANLITGKSAAAHKFTLDFTTDGKKARVYMGGVNDDSTNDLTDEDAINVQKLNNGVPAGGIDEYIYEDQSAAIVPKDTTFWVNKEVEDGKNVYRLIYAYGAKVPDVTTSTGYYYQFVTDDILAKEAIVAAEYSQWDPDTQENGGTRPYRINVKIADPETDPSIEELTVGGVNAVLREDADQGIATWTVNLPASSTPHQPMTIKFKGNFTTATIDGESFDKQAYYIVNKYAPVTIVATSESGVNKRYILKVGESDVSSDNSLKSIRVDGYTAVRDGATNDYYVTPGDNANLSEMSLYVTTNHSGAKVTVNSQPYTEGMTISLDGQDAKIDVTAENGDKATYNLKVGEAPAEKPSDKITDLDKCSNSLRSEVAEAIDLGIVQGVGNNKFDPQRKVTRKEFAVMVARADIIAAGKASSTSAADDVLKTEYLAAGGKFTDVAGQSEIFRAAINYCSANEIINGTGDGTTFSPDGTITREQAATMLARWTNTTSGSTTNTTFSDWNDVSNWAKGAVNGVTSTDPAIMNGIGGSKFGPKGTVTREMAATLVKRVYVNYSSK